MERWLWGLRQRRGWIDLDFSVAAHVIDFPEGAWGAALANELPTAAYLVLRNECLLQLFAKLLRDGVLSVLGKMAPGGFGSRRRSSAAGNGSRRPWHPKGYWAFL
jgi:hypothetical protein